MNDVDKESAMHRCAVALLTVSGFAVLPQALGADAKVVPLMTQPLADVPNKEVLMLTVEYGPGDSSPIHRHNADVFVYVLEGAVMLGLQGREPVRVEAGQTFHEAPGDIHAVSSNASKTAKAKFVVVMVKNKGAPPTVPVK
jgi:quercetin dioxygenase-like cupin family protein